MTEQGPSPARPWAVLSDGTGIYERTFCTTVSVTYIHSAWLIKSKSVKHWYSFRLEYQGTFLDQSLSNPPNVNPYWSSFELNSSGLSAVPSPMSRSNRHFSLSCFMLVFPKLLLKAALKFEDKQFSRKLIWTKLLEVTTVI